MGTSISEEVSSFQLFATLKWRQQVSPDRLGHFCQITEYCNVSFQAHKEFVIMSVHFTDFRYDKAQAFILIFLCILCTIQKSSSSSMSAILGAAFY
jgi:hypothetical protein